MSLRWLAGRLLAVIPVVLVVYAFTFFVIKATPGSPFATRASRELPPAVEARLEQTYGLADPWYEQFVRYPVRAVQGDLGPSYARAGDDVRDIVFAGLGTTLTLVLGALVLGGGTGIVLGVVAALRRGGVLDGAVGALSSIGLAVPVFATTSILLVVFGVHYRLVPVRGFDGLLSTSAIVPLAALALDPMAVFARFTRESVIEVLHSDHVRALRATGLSARRILVRHVLKNALVPVVTAGGLEVAVLAGSVAAVEQVAGIKGAGSLLVSALVTRDYPVIMAVTLLLTVVVALANLAVDVAYHWLDPRMRPA